MEITITEFIYENEDSIPEDLFCPICSAPFIEPVEHTSCGIEFCRECINKWHSSCPNCRETPITNIKPVTAKRLLTKLYDLKVKCPQCSKVCQRGDLAKHATDCFSIGILQFKL